MSPVTDRVDSGEPIVWLDHAEKPSPTLYVVSHRLPIVFDETTGWTRAPGGLVSALTSALAHRHAVWFGHCAGDALLPLPVSGSASIVPIRLSAHEVDMAIDGCCNRTLWPALHGFVQHIEQRCEWWRVYVERGARTAALIADRAERSAAVWIHDYHHIPVGGPLRMRRPDLGLGFSFHTPFDDRAMSMIDGHREVAGHLAALDVIGTQTERDAAAVRRFLLEHGVDEPPLVEAIPVGFDVDAWRRRRADLAVAAIATELSVPEGVLAIGVDRVDYTKGLEAKLAAVELLLTSGAVTPDEFRLLQVAVPSRQAVPAYSALERRLGEFASRVNAAHRRRDRLPVIDLRFGQLAPCEIAGIMRAADIALVTPVRDGMNLVALEFSVINGDRPTDLVLGVGAGVSDHLGGWSDTVDGGDAIAIAGSLLRILRKPDPDRANRSRHRGEIATEFTSQRWAATFLARLGARSHDRISH